MSLSLSTPAGLHALVRHALVAAMLMASSSTAFAAVAAGQVMMLTGRATATDPGASSVRELARGDAVHAGEIISSGVNSYLNLKFSDGSFILLRPGTRFVIEEFVDTTAPAPTTIQPQATPPPVAVQPAPARQPAAPLAGPASPTQSRAFFRLLKGGFRAVSGLIGKADQNEYRVSTPVATIGIRGTDYIVVVCDKACAQDKVLQEDLPGGVSAEGGLVANIVDGSIRLDSSARKRAELPLTSAYGWLGTSLLLMQGAPPPVSDAIPIDDSSITLPAQVNGSLVTNVVIGPNGKIYPLGQTPQFLVEQPLPDPRTLCP